MPALRRKSGRKTFTWLFLVVIAAAVLWYCFSNGEEELDFATSSPDGGMAVKGMLAVWQAEVDAGKHEKVISEISSALAGGAVKQRAAAMWILADALKKAKKNAESLRILGRIAREFPNTTEGIKAKARLKQQGGKGTSLFQSGEYAKAVGALRIELASAKEDKKPQLLWYIALCHEYLDNLDNATQTYERLCLEFPNSAFASDAAFQMAIVAHRKGDLPDSLERFIVALKKAPVSPAAERAAVHIAPGLYERFVVAKKELSKWPALREVLCLQWRMLKPDERQDIEAKLRIINDYVLFAPFAEGIGTAIYTVKRDDNLGLIARKFKVSVSLIKRVNHLKKDTIFPDQKLKILLGDAKIVINKSLFKLVLLLDDKFVRAYAIGIGREGIETETPIGHFKISGMDTDPVWYKDNERIPHDDPRNILGTRWISLSIPHYGIHGTKDESTVGKHSSAGCIRMRNRDVEELYDFVSIGDTVIIED